ncbi:unnamed protein product [Protopolystoma xenopodis]|uniref:Uncharacterized protein n=1 Tax=Protopolystoma xenopodis TaxID=117903 RepID=A0A3S5A3T0_9PLAT|nr:unnamed protein product [Protopolystoma xenopodis]
MPIARFPNCDKPFLFFSGCSFLVNLFLYPLPHCLPSDSFPLSLAAASTSFFQRPLHSTSGSSANHSTAGVPSGPPHPYMLPLPLHHSHQFPTHHGYPSRPVIDGPGRPMGLDRREPG